MAENDPGTPPARPPADPGPPPAGPPASPPAPDPDPAGKQPPWGKPENFDADKAWELIQNLRNEKTPDRSAAEQKFEQQLNEMREAQAKQNAALAQAFGLAEPPKTEEDLSEKLRELQESIQKDRLDNLRDALVIKYGIAEEHQDLLTETDPEKLKAQAEKVGALIAGASTPPGQQPPAFQSNPGQGRGGTPDAKAAEDAEYRAYFPESQPRK